MSLLYDTYVIWYREMLRYRRNAPYLVAQIAFPLLFIIVIGLGFNNIVTLPGNVSYLDFLSSGILVFFVASGALGGGFNLIEERKEGFLKVVIIAPISRASIILGKIAARVSFSTLQILLFLSVIATYANITFQHLWLTVLSLAAIAALFVCVGVFIAAFLGEAESYRIVTGFIMIPVYVLSGIFFPVTTLPGWLQFIARINPLTYAVDLFRFSILGVHEFSLVLNAVLLAILSGVVFVLATTAFDRRFRN